MTHVWKWDAFYKWLLKLLHYTETPAETAANSPALVWVYETRRPKKKDLGVLEPFIKPSIRYMGSSPLQDATLFPNGLYVLADGDKWLFLVFPTLVAEHGKVGNHFTFVLDTND